MRNGFRLKFLVALGMIAPVLFGCGSPAAPSAGTPSATTPTVELGYFYYERSEIPAAFVDYEAGMTIKAESKNKYKETISYPSGKTTNVEFTMTSRDPIEYEALINGVAKKVPSFDEYSTSIKPKLKNKLAFTFMPMGFAEPLMQIPTLCAQDSGLKANYSTVPGRDALKSLDSITVSCPSSGKVYTFQFSYERGPESYITSFTVYISEGSAK